MRCSTFGAFTLYETAAARRVSTVMRRSRPTSISSQASAMAASIAPTNQDMRVAATPSVCSTLRALPLSSQLVVAGGGCDGFAAR